jgi:hypothetical protein
MAEIKQQLAAQRLKFTAELEQAENASKQLRTKAEELRKKISAIDTLIGAERAEEGDARVQDDASRLEPSVHGDVFTLVKEYWRSILQSLVEMGGRGRREEVIDAAGKNMAGILTPADYEMLVDSPVIRWRSRVVLQASNMQTQGLIKKDSPRGLWEIADEGRKWLEERSP